MGVRNCARCGKIFNYMAGPPLCAACRDKDEQDFKKVKEYLYDNPGAIMTEVAQELDIPVSKIKRFLKEGRLEIKKGSNFFLQCERCGTSIRSGRYCEECSHEIANEINALSNKAANQANRQADNFNQNARMRYFNR